MTGAELAIAGQAVNTGVSVAKTLSGIIKQNKASKIDIATVDPEETQALADIKARSRALRMGAAYGRTIREIKSGSKVGSTRVFSSGTALRSLVNKINSNENQALLALNNASEAALTQNLALENQMRTRISQRKLEVDLLKRSELKAEGASSKKVGMENLLGLINNIDPTKVIGGGKGENTNPPFNEIAKRSGFDLLAQDPLTPNLKPKSALDETFSLPQDPLATPDLTPVSALSEALKNIR